MKLAAASSREELSAAKREYSESMADKERAIKALVDEKVRLEASARDATIVVEAELKNVRAQLENVSEACEAKRKECKGVAAELKRESAKRQKLEADLAAALDDLERERDATSEAAEAHQRSMAAMQATLRDLKFKAEDEKETMNLKLSAAHSKISTTQADLIAYRDKMVDASDEWVKKVALARVCGFRAKFMASKMSSAFAKWRLRSALEVVKAAAAALERIA